MIISMLRRFHASFSAKTPAEYAALITEAGAILKAMGIHPSDSLTKIGRIGDVLVRLKDARAVPILSRGFFFTGPTVPLGDDSWYCSPEDIALDKFTLLLWSSKSKLSETFPKYDYRMRNRNYYDFVRKWLLENREQAMSAEFPKLANIQEAPFRAYLTAKAQSPPVAENPELNDDQTIETKTPKVLMVFFIGVVLLLLFFWRTKRSNRPSGKRK